MRDRVGLGWAGPTSDSRSRPTELGAGGGEVFAGSFVGVRLARVSILHSYEGQFGSPAGHAGESKNGLSTAGRIGRLGRSAASPGQSAMWAIKPNGDAQPRSRWEMRVRQMD